MKKLFTLCTAMIIATVFAFAQQGQIVLGVNSQIDNVSWQDYHLVPTVGYFLSDNLMVGTGFHMSAENSGDEMTDSLGWPGTAATLNTYNTMSLSPFVRYYLNERLFAAAGISLSTTKNFDDNGYYYISSYDGNGNPVVSEGTNTTDVRTSEFGFHAAVGYSLMYNDYICFEPAFVISSSGGSGTTTTEQTTYDPTSGQWYINTVETEQGLTKDEPGVFTMGIRLGINIRLGE